MADTKQIEYKGHSVTCGAIYELKVTKGFSDYAISTLSKMPMPNSKHLPRQVIRLP